MAAAPHIGDPVAHPAAELFPMLNDDEIRPLVDSMRRNGFDPSKPILRYAGVILDGRNRLRASMLAGVDPVFADVPLDRDPYQESWKHNGLRRDLTPGQKAAIVAKITSMSLEWQTEREGRARAANEARADKVREQPRSDGGRFTGALRNRSATERPKRAAAVLAEKAGVAESTMALALKIQREDPEQLDAIIRGEKKPRKPAAPRVDHDTRNAEVLRLHEQGLSGVEIAHRMKIHPGSVSTAKQALGIDEKSPPIKLWSDIDHAVTTLEGGSHQFERLAEQLSTTEINANAQEIKQCIKSLSKSVATVKALRSALRLKLPQ